MIGGSNVVQVFDRNIQLINDLENAHDIRQEEIINSLGHLEFTLPYNDPKNRDCKPLNYVRLNNGQLHRIMASGKTITETGDWRYRCEHVFATLLDRLLPRNVILGGLMVNTALVIKQILARQIIRHWELGDCDFDYYFEYGFSGETLLAAVLDVPHHFTEPFMWEFDTNVYPWVLHLRRLNPNAIPTLYIEQGANRIKAIKRKDVTTLCTRIFPYGHGEGEYQLTIESVNGGSLFLQSPTEIIQQYGIIEKEFIEPRIHNAQSLKDIAASILEEVQTPFEEFSVDFAPLNSIPAIGEVVDIVDFKTTFVTAIKWRFGEVPTCTLRLANRTRNIADEVLQMRNRQRITSMYAQGVAQFWQYQNFMNAMPNHPAELPLWLPNSLHIVQQITLMVQLRPFRMDVRNTDLAGATTLTSTQPSLANTSNNTAFSFTPSGTISSNGAQTVTPSGSVTQGGGHAHTGSATIPNSGAHGHTVNITIQNGGGHIHTTTTSNTSIVTGVTTQTTQFVTSFAHGQTRVSWSDGETTTTNVSIPNHSTVAGVSSVTANTSQTQIVTGLQQAGDHNHTATANIPNSGDHTHNVNLTINHGGEHSHGLNMNQIHITAHTHTFTGFQVTVPAHSHAMPHTHNTTLPNHQHQLTPAITNVGSPNGFTVRINGINRQTFAGTNTTVSIQPWLVNSQGMLNRGQLNQIEVLTTAPAFVRMVVLMEGMLMAQREVIL